LQLESDQNIVTRETHKNKKSPVLCHQFDSILAVRAVKKLSKQRLHAKHTFVIGGGSM